MKIEKLKRMGKMLLKEKGIDEREARLLLAFALHKSENELILVNECSEEEANTFLSLIHRRREGMPYAYLTQKKEFMRLPFFVDEHVLIPRPETELLVEEVLQYSSKRVLDLCTGSGCIAIAIAHYGENMQVEASDISESALKVAEKNAKANDVTIKFIASDLFEKITSTYDIIVSNPPYIEKNVITTLEKEVQNEPYLALEGGEDGLLFYRKIIAEARDYLNPNGMLILEIGYNQKQAVEALLQKYQYQQIECKKDLSDNDRMMIAKIK